ncbi:unnamed protein product [Arabidopsis lyrata]|nr:unnamed protein product [Arabidopsis lyrata]
MPPLHSPSIFKQCRRRPLGCASNWESFSGSSPEDLCFSFLRNSLSSAATSRRSAFACVSLRFNGSEHSDSTVRSIPVSKWRVEEFCEC